MLKVAFIRFLLFWGIWLLVPMTIDGITALLYLWVSFKNPKKARVWDYQVSTKSFTSMVTALIPVYNAEETLYRCLESLAGQTYPIRRMEVICIGNGVTDNSRQEFKRAQQNFPQLRMSWIDTPKGKSHALNSGILVSKGNIIFNIDADARLAKDALHYMMKAFTLDARLGAASGVIQVDMVDESESWWWRLLNSCEIAEYMQAFLIGRKFQTHRDAVFTLSGAFAAFRREVLVETYLYDDSTVSEDTKLTFDIRNIRSGKWRIECVEESVAFVEPIKNISKFMSQRLRWQRGQLEVLSLSQPHYNSNPITALGNFASRMLIADHTLAFPRLVWTFIMPFLYLLGYSLPLVAMAMWLTYFMYVCVESAFLISIKVPFAQTYSKSLKEWWHLSLIMPIYRFGIYWFRLAGMLYALSEDAQWSTENEVARIGRELSRLGGVFRRKDQVERM